MFDFCKYRWSPSYWTFSWGEHLCWYFMEIHPIITQNTKCISTRGMVLESHVHESSGRNFNLVIRTNNNWVWSWPHGGKWQGSNNNCFLRSKRECIKTHFLLIKTSTTIPSFLLFTPCTRAGGNTELNRKCQIIKPGSEGSIIKSQRKRKF